MLAVQGSPEQIGTLWGTLNKEIILDDMEATYLKPARAAGITQAELIERSAEYVQIAEQLAPHWLEEARATARAAGIEEDLYLAFIDGQSRKRFLHECTSYAVSPAHTANGAILFHKTRDNVDRPQAVCVVESSVKGINKFIAVSDASRIRCSMMVNDKGLAGSGDYPADRKKDSSQLDLKSAPPQYRGLMAGSILRHIAERASTCQEALDIIEQCVASGHYAGGEINGSHWLFVDREGHILEVCNNSQHVVSQFHTQKTYFSRLNDSPAARRLKEQTSPIHFQQFRNVSRDPSICFGSSISGMTVEIDPVHPELFTCAWVALPARTVAFPLLMGQTSTPACLVDGTAYQQGRKSPKNLPRWEGLESTAHAEKVALQAEVLASLEAGNPVDVITETLEEWSSEQAQSLMKELRAAPAGK